MGKKLFEYIQDIQKCVNNLEKLQRGYTNDDILVAFRGEPRDFGKTKLVPSLFRQPDMLEKEFYIFELMSDYGLLDVEKERWIDKAIESQHYVAISRMLDITFSILPAIYFACGDERDLSEDGILYVFCFPEHYSPHSAYLEAFYRNILEDKKNITYSKNFKVITHSYSNERIEAQSGGFIFFPGKDYIPINSVYYEKIPIYTADKKELRADLKKLFNVEEATLFPEKSKRANLVKKILEKEKYTKRELCIKNEIETCFDRILFEIEVQKRKVPVEKKTLLRKLRKEKDDLLTFVRMLNIDDEVRKSHVENIEKRFALLEKMY